MLFETMTLKSAAMLLGSSLALGGATYFLYQRAKRRYGETSSGVPPSSPPHNGSKQGDFETLNDTLSHKLRSEQSERANE